MSTTTVHLDDHDDELLDALAAEFGGRTDAIRHAIRELAERHRRRDALQSFLDDWDRDDSAPVGREAAATPERDTQ